MIIFKMKEIVIVGNGIEDLCVNMEEVFNKVNGGKYNIGLEGDEEDRNIDIEEFVIRIVSKRDEDVYGWVDGFMERGDDLYKVEVVDCFKI